MLNIPGFNLLNVLFRNHKIEIVRAYSDKLNKTVILKVLTDEHPSPKDIAALKHEYNLLKELKSPGVIEVYHLERYDHFYFLILEDIPDAILLKDYIENERIKIDLFLPLAIQLVKTLHDLHALHIIHKDINPFNLIISQQDHSIKIIDFSIATKLSQEMPEIKSAEVIEGTLPYMSPEQSSRMNRAVDHRTDLYSLAMTFYEMLTGELPFKANDAMEWIHCHIAKQPKPPHLIQESIPKIISDMIIKLLSKSAEDRYMTAKGLRIDLETCLNSWQRKHEIEPFKLGQKDKSGFFHIPNKLYGREVELQKLLITFERISRRGKELLLVSGYPGIGKSSLINEIHKPIVRKRGYFISGKFEQFQQQIPYSAMIQAFRKLILQLLTESPEKIEFWRNELSNALTPNGQVIIEVIPEVEWLIGKQPPVAMLPPSEARNRFELIFFDFVHTFSKSDHPLVLFLDDLQWVDSASLNLAKQLLRDESLENFLLIGSYRDNEVQEGDLLLETVEEIKKEGIAIEYLRLKNLSIESIKNLIIDTLNTTIDIQPLAELILEKTGGNPFFVNEFLTNLYQQKFLHYEVEREEWVWDMLALKTFTITENVVDLIIDRISKLPQESQDLLKIASSIGNQFDLNTIYLICHQSISEITQNLWPPLQENLIIPLDENYKLVMADENFAKFKQKISYKFAHDRIQQAAYSMMDEEERKNIDLKIGRVLLEHVTPEELEEKLFEIVNHFNVSIDLIRDQEEKIRIAELNIKAGHKARLSVAYTQAESYFSKAIILLGKKSWEDHYSMALDANLGFAECMHLQGKFEQAEVEFIHITQKLKTDLDRAYVSMLQVLSYTLQLKYEKAIKAGLEGLKFLGFHIAEYPSVLRVAYELIKTRLLLRKKNPEDILTLKQITDPEKKLAVEFFERLAVAAYLTNPNLIAVLAMRGIQFCLKNGYSKGTAPQFIMYSMISIAGFYDFSTAYEYTKLSLKITEQFDDLRMKTIISFSAATLIFPWKKPYKFCSKILSKVFQLGRQSGELLYSNYAAALYPQMLLAQGVGLKEIEKKLKKMFIIADFTKNIDTFASLRTLARMLPVMTGNKPLIYFQERADIFLKNLIPYSHPATDGVSGILCLMAAYVFEEWELGIKIMEKTKPFSQADYFQPLFVLSEYFFYASLLMIVSYQDASFIDKIKYKKLIKKYTKKLNKFSLHCSENYLAKYLLVSAGWQHVSGHLEEAFLLYEQAITSARENQLIHIEGFINDLICKLFLQKNQTKNARIYAQEAFYAFKKWGATFKVKILQDKFKNIEKEIVYEQKDIENLMLQESKESFDLNRVVQFSQEISGNVFFDDLLKDFMRICIINLEASKGVLFLEKNHQLVATISYESEREEQFVILNSRVKKNEMASEFVVQYVQNTLETLVLNKNTIENNYNNDPYFLEKNPASILCLPLINKGNLLGVLYLENNLKSNVFNYEKIELLKLLVSQVAISIENTQVYTAYNRFIPYKFIAAIGKQNIIDIQLSDGVEKNMTILIAHVKHFNQLTNTVKSEEIFQLINQSLSVIESIIHQHDGFIVKLTNDLILVLFEGSVQEAVLASVAIQEKLIAKKGLIKLGMAIHTGLVKIGITGVKNSMMPTVIGQTIEQAKNLHRLTKKFNSKILMSDTSFQLLKDKELFQYRNLGHQVWEIYTADDEKLKFAKMAVSAHYDQAMELFSSGSFKEALRLFERCSEKVPEDKVIKTFIYKCKSLL